MPTTTTTSVITFLALCCAGARAEPYKGARDHCLLATTHFRGRRNLASEPPGTPGALQVGDAIRLKSHTGNYVAVNGGDLIAQRNGRPEWEKFFIEKKAPSSDGDMTIQSGDAVYLRTHDRKHVVTVERGTVKAAWDHMGSWERLVIMKKGSGGPIFANDVVYLRAHTGKYITVQGRRAEVNEVDAQGKFPRKSMSFVVVGSDDGTATTAAATTTPSPTTTPHPTPQLSPSPSLSPMPRPSHQPDWPASDVNRYHLDRKRVLDRYQSEFSGEADPPQTACPHWKSQGDATVLTGGMETIKESGVRQTADGHLQLQARRYHVEKSLDLSDRSLLIPEGATLVIKPWAKLTVSEIIVRGTMLVGSESCPHDHGVQTTITLAGAKSTPQSRFHHSMGKKGLVVESGGKLEMFGKRFTPTWTRISATAQKGTKQLQLKHRVNWAEGMRIVITTTVWKDEEKDHQNEVHTIASLQMKGGIQTVTLRDELAFTHYGGVEYQAEVGLLSRAITIQGDAQSEDDHFGGHLMCMRNSDCRVEGVRAYRMGQLNTMGRYPLHFHMMGTVNEKSYFKYCAVERSFFRAITIHATNKARVEYNVAYDIAGHAMYLEDGVEEDNEISYNLVAFVHVIGRDSGRLAGGYESRTHAHLGVPHLRSCPESEVNVAGTCKPDVSALVAPDVAASGFYCTNAHNTWIGNAASGGFSGFIFPALPYALGKSYSRNKDFVPLAREMKTFDGNTAHSSGRLWQWGGNMYIGGAIVNDPLGSERYVYTYGRAWQDDYVHSGMAVDGTRVSDMRQDRKIIKYAMPKIQYTITNLRVAIGKLGFLFWGAASSVKLPYALNDRFEAHDVFKAAHLMGVASIKGAIWTGHTPNVRGPGESDFRSARLPQSSHLFEQYDLGMATVLADIHCRGLYTLGNDQDAGDVCIKDVTRSSTINSILTISGLTVDQTVDQRLWFRHVRRDSIQGKGNKNEQTHCAARNGLAYFRRDRSLNNRGIVYPGPWNAPCGSTKRECEQQCPGTSYSSQVVVMEVQDGSLAHFGSAFARGALLGGSDGQSETGGTVSSTNNWWQLDSRCQEKFSSPYSRGFWVCSRAPMAQGFGIRSVVNMLMFDISKYKEHNVEFLGGKYLPLQGGAEPSPWAVSGTVSHFGNGARRLELNKGLAQVQGPCCDVGWYFRASDAPYGILGIQPMRMVMETGLVFATSYRKGAKIAVRECRKERQQRSCAPVPMAGSLAGLKRETRASLWHQRDSSKSKQVFLKIINPDKQAFVEIGDVKLPHRSPGSVAADVWYEIENTGDKSQAPMDLPPQMWSSSFASDAGIQ
jgi:hypothetical protein